MTVGITVPVKKDEIPKALLPYIKQDSLAGRIKSTWTEIAGWDSCKLVARKQGAVTRYAIRHYGYYECCRKAEMKVAGVETHGTSYRELPMWALTLWILAKDRAKKSIAEGYRVTQTRIRLVRWERKAMNQFTLYFVEVNTQTEWKVSVFRDDKSARYMRFYSRNLATDLEWAA